MEFVNKYQPTASWEFHSNVPICDWT